MDEPTPIEPTTPPKPKTRCKRVNVTQFLQSPAEALYQEGFFEIKPEEIRIRLRIVNGQVEMTIAAFHQGRVDNLIANFKQGEVYAELCG